MPICLSQEAPTDDQIYNKPITLSEEQLNMDGVLAEVDVSKLSETQLNYDGLLEKLTDRQFERLTESQLGKYGVLAKIPDLTKLNQDRLASVTQLNKISFEDGYSGLKFENDYFVNEKGGKIHKSILTDKNVEFTKAGIIIKRKDDQGVETVIKSSLIEAGADITSTGFTIPLMDGPASVNLNMNSLDGDIDFSNNVLSIGDAQFKGLTSGTSIKFIDKDTMKAHLVESVKKGSMEVVSQAAGGKITVEIIDRTDGSSRGIQAIDSDVLVTDYAKGQTITTKLAGNAQKGNGAKYFIIPEAGKLGFNGAATQTIMDQNKDLTRRITSMNGALSTFDSNGKYTSVTMGTDSKSINKNGKYTELENGKIRYFADVKSIKNGATLYFSDDAYNKAKESKILLSEKVLTKDENIGGQILKSGTSVRTVKQSLANSDVSIEYQSAGNPLIINKNGYSVKRMSQASETDGKVMKDNVERNDGISTLFEDKGDTLAFTNNGVFSKNRNSKIVPLQPIDSNLLKMSKTFTDGQLNVELVGISEKSASRSGSSLGIDTIFKMDADNPDNQNVARVTIDPKFRDIVAAGADVAIGKSGRCSQFTAETLKGACGQNSLITNTGDAWIIEGKVAALGGKQVWKNDDGIESFNNIDINPGDVVTFQNTYSRWDRGFYEDDKYKKASSRYKNWYKYNKENVDEPIYVGNEVPTHIAVLVQATETMIDGTTRTVPYIMHQGGTSYGSRNHLEPFRDYDSKENINTISVFSRLKQKVKPLS